MTNLKIMNNIITVKNLKKNYQDEHALKGIDFSVPSGSMFGIIGPDGAGKTTLMQILTTLIQSDTGTVEVMSYSVKSDFQYIRQSIGYMPQKFSLYEDLSVSENLNFFAEVFSIFGTERKEKTERLLSFSRLEPFSKRRAGNLSGGMKQKLALCCALIHTPKLLILDEPTVGVDPVSREEFWEILRELHSQGITIVISTPYMNEAAYCDELVLLNNGSVLLEGSPASLCSEYPLYLYKIAGHSNLLSYSADLELPQGLEFVYSCKGELHAASSIPQDKGEMVTELVKTVIPGVTSLSSQEPDVEDVFIYWLSKTEKEGLPVHGTKQQV
jgi:ABC-type multidrug transport system ATPase subunit